MLCIPICFSAVLIASISLEENSRKFVDDRVKHCDSVLSISRFVNYENNAKQGNFSFNTNFWLSGVDFSCASPWNDKYGRQRGGTAISKRHIIFAKHFPIAKGTRIHFSDDNGGVCHCRVDDMREIPNSDIAVGLLDYELTPNIHPARILPDGFQKYMPVGSRWPVVTINQREQALLSMATCKTNSRTGALYLLNGVAEDESWRKIGGTLVGGDSGSPAFLLIKGEVVLLHCVYIGGIGFGPGPHEYRREIQAAMNDMCPGYQLQCYDFSNVCENKSDVE